MTFRRPSAASFGAAGRAGMIDAASANAFIPADGPHRVLVQLQLNTDPDEVAEIVSDALSAHRYYIAQVKPWDVIPVD